MAFQAFIEEFESDWQLAGKARGTAMTYARYLRQLAEFCDGGASLADVKRWLATAISLESARGRARAVRAFGKWCAANDGPDFSWWPRVPLANTKVRPQPTVTPEIYERTLARAECARDRLVVELLWSTGCRVSELSRLAAADVSVAGQFIMVRESKTGVPRLAPLSDRACRLIRRHTPPQGHHTLLGMSRGAIQQLMRRLDAPTPHAWRRGWAVEALRSGVSETSVRSAAGWSSGAMVARYTAAMSSDLAMDEFRRRSAR